MRIKCGLATLAAVTLLLCSLPAVASIEVQPMSYDLAPTGTGTQQNLRVANSSATPTAVEVRVERRHILPDGTERREPADDDFLVFPPQGVVPANGFQTFRVQYIGNAAIERTALYSVTVAQLPVDTSGSGASSVQIVFNLGTLAAVSPSQSVPKIVVTNVAPSEEPGKVTISVSNQGTRYARLRGGRWTLVGGDGKSHTLAPEEVSAAIEQPLIEPGTERIVKLPVPAGFVRAGARAQYELVNPAR